MEIIETLTVQAVDLNRQKIVEYVMVELQLRTRSIRAKYIFYANETDCEDPMLRDNPSEWKENVYNHFEITVLSNKIAGTELVFCSDAEIWKVLIFIIGVYKDLVFYFEQQSKASSFKDRIDKYIINIQ